MAASYMLIVAKMVDRYWESVMVLILKTTTTVTTVIVVLVCFVSCSLVNCLFSF